jgi:hypothetical protein
MVVVVIIVVILLATATLPVAFPITSIQTEVASPNRGGFPEQER